MTNEALDNQARQERWTAYRKAVYKARAEFRRKCEEEGRGFLQQPELPINPPASFERKDGLVTQTTYEHPEAAKSLLRKAGRVLMRPAGSTAPPSNQLVKTDEHEVRPPSPMEAFGDAESDGDSQ